MAHGRSAISTALLDIIDEMIMSSLILVKETDEYPVIIEETADSHGIE